MFDAKSKSLESDLSSEVTYVVKESDSSVGYKQVELHEFLV